MDESLQNSGGSLIPIDSALGQEIDFRKCLQAPLTVPPGRQVPIGPAGHGGSPGEVGVAVTHCGDKDTSGRSSRKYSST